MSWLKLTTVLGVLTWSATSLAASVVLVRPSNPTAHTTEAMVRIRSELASAGFTTEEVDEALVKDQDGQSQDWLEQVATNRSADAVIALQGDKTPDSVEVWVIDRVTGKSVMRRVPVLAASTKGPETLAIQAVELLRASFVEIELTSRIRRTEAKPAAPPAVVRWVKHEARPRRAGIELGATASLGLGGVAPALMPIARLDWNATERFFAQVSVAGMGTRPTIESEMGRAQMSHAFALLGTGARFKVGPRLIPFVSVAAGAMFTSVEGNASSLRYQGTQLSRWSFLLDGEFGTRFAIEERLFLAFSTHVQFAEPYLAIRFAGSEVATYARPNILFTLTFGTWL